jgi:ABC-2 type transport system ATP-binding protein
MARGKFLFGDCIDGEGPPLYSWLMEEAAMDNAIEINALCKDFKSFSLKEVTFSLPQGHIMGFVGKNGAGKTTTIRLIFNMLARKSGSVKVFGLDNIADEQKIKQDVGAVFDEIFFVGTWKVSQVEKAIKGFYGNWDSALFSKYIKNFNLPADKRVKDLSRGMKMKLMLAVALSHDAKLLILDEPTSGLDPVARDELLDILSEYVFGGEKTILFSTHITSDLEKIAGYITLIDDGRIFYTGPKDRLLKDFFIVKGGPGVLTEPLRGKIVGLAENKAGFSGLMRASETKGLPRKISRETPTIDEILVAISRGGGNHE